MTPEVRNRHVRRLDHVGIATWSIEQMLPLYRDIIGGRFMTGGDDDERGLRTVHLSVPERAKVELLMPSHEHSVLLPFLRDRGPGVHHLTFLVHSLEALTEDLVEQGYETTGTSLHCSRWRETYLRPRSGDGVLIQFADSTEDWTEPATDISLDDVLAGGVEWIDYVPRLRRVGTPERTRR